MRILCATDLLPKSDAAIERAAILSDRLGADLTLLHVVVPEQSHRTLEHSLRWATAEMEFHVRAPRWQSRRAPEIAVHAGNPVQIILDTAAQSQARLLVLGSHRPRPLRDALEGTIAQKALAAKRYPVLVARDETPEPYGRVLLALDTSAASASAIRAAESLVLGPDVEAAVVNAHRPPYEDMLHTAGVEPETVERYAESWRHEADRSVRELLDFESADPARYDIHIEQKRATPGILSAVERFAPDLLVMGTRGGNRLHRALVGSLANRVLHETACDVLIVPDGSFDAERVEPRLGDRGSRRSAYATDSR